MPEKKQGQVILMSEQQMKTMPILAMRDVCVLPGMLVHLDVSREITKRAIEEAMAEDGSIFLTLQRDESIETPSFHDLYEIGVIAKIKQEVKVMDDVLRVMISTKERGILLSLIQRKPFLKGEVVPYEWGDEELRPGALEKEAMCRNLKDVYTIYLNENPRASRSDLEKIQGMKDLGKLTDLIAMHINKGFDKRQEILECLDLELRNEMVAGILTNEVNLSRIREGYRRKVKEEVDKNQKEYFLREQMKVIRNELGDGASAEEYQEKYKEQLEQLSCSEEVYQKIAEEIITKEYDYINPSIQLLISKARLDSGVYSNQVFQWKSNVENYNSGYSNLEEFGFKLKRGPNLAKRDLGRSIQTKRFRKGYSLLIYPSDISSSGYINEVSYLGARNPIWYLGKSDILFSAEGTIGKTFIVCDDTMKFTTNFHGTIISPISPEISLDKSIFIGLYLNFLRSNEVLSKMSVGANGGSFAVGYWDNIIITIVSETFMSE